MKFKIKILVLLLFLSCKMEKKPVNDMDNVSGSNDLVEAERLMQIQEDDNLVIVDFRKPEYFHQGHIPGAVNIWRTDLENKNYPFGGMMPEKEELEQVLGKLGIESNDHLVIYDDKGSVDAARLWWLLRYYYFDSVRLLNGGLSAWQGVGGILSIERTKYLPTQFKLPDSSRTGMLAKKEFVKKWVFDQNRKAVLVDVRSDDEYSGRIQKLGAKRAGHIPRSIHIEWSKAIDFNDHNKFRSEKELKSMFEPAGIGTMDTVVIYCHSGSRSAHTAFVLEKLLKYKWVMNYDGSWTEWSYFDDLPVIKDSVNLEIN